MKTIQPSSAHRPALTTPAPILTLFLALLLGLTSCKKDNDPAPDPVAVFEGKFEAQYEDPADNYTLTISRHSSRANAVKILNLGDFMNNIPVVGEVSGNQLTIATQTFPVSNGKKLTITGNGTLSNHTLTLYYKVGGAYNFERNEKAVRIK